MRTGKSAGAGIAPLISALTLSRTPFLDRETKQGWS